MTMTMAMTMISGISDSACHASHNRKEDWQKCCSLVLGFDWVDDFGDSEGKDASADSAADADVLHDSSIVEIVDLVDDEEDGDESKQQQQVRQSDDPWMQHALRIQSDLRRMTAWIRSKKSSYISVQMRQEEASLIQSTISSFTAITASELETLRKMIDSTTATLSTSNTISTAAVSKDLMGHRNGVVQFLLTELKENIAEPFAILQKQRARAAVEIWQNPYQCTLYQSSKVVDQQSRMLRFFEEDAGAVQDQRFLPQGTLAEEEDFAAADDEFAAMYCAPQNDAGESISDLPVPTVLSEIVERRQHQVAREDAKVEPFGFSTIDEGASNADSRPQQLSLKAKPLLSSGATPSSSVSTNTQSRRPQQQQNYYEYTQEESKQHFEEQLAQEAALLTVTAQNDLDSVQQVETRMIEITTLIGQFASLVSEQQEDIWQIQESSAETKQNIDKGQENLVDAADRTKRSKHYMAKCIVAMAFVLLFFHTVRW